MMKETTVKFIKLGKSGDWERECIEGDKLCIRLGFVNPHHDKCINGDWEFIKDYWRESKSEGKATEITNQIKAFYTEPRTTMWITFYKRKLYYCFAKEQVTQDEDGSRIREVDGTWKSHDVKNNPLFVENLSGKLTKVQGFRGTICSVKESEYLLRRINAEALPEVEAAKASHEDLIQKIKPLITNLGWHDFELAVDLVFANAGWQRIATLGKVEKSIDLDVLSPVTGLRAFIQVKSQSSLGDFKKYIEKFEQMPQYDEMYYICHTGTSVLEDVEKPSNVRFIGLEHMAKLIVSAGLTEWLITKSS